MHVKLTSSKRLFDILQETSYRHIADEQTLLKIRLPDVNITSNRLVLWITFRMDVLFWGFKIYHSLPL